MHLRAAHARADQLRERLEGRERGSELVGDDREELFPFPLACQEIGDVVEGHHAGDDLPIRAAHRSRTHVELAPFAGVGPSRDDLASSLLAPQGSIHRVRTEGNRFSGHDVRDLDRGAELGERFELADAEYFSRAWIRLAASARPADDDTVAERIQQMPMELALCDGLRVKTRVRDSDRGRRRQQVRELDVLGCERPAPILRVDRKRSNELVLENERYGKQLGQSFSGDKRTIAEAAAGQIQDHVLAGTAKLSSHVLDRESLSGDVVLGESFLRANDEGGSLAIR